MCCIRGCVPLSQTTDRERSIRTCLLVNTPGRTRTYIPLRAPRSKRGWRPIADTGACMFCPSNAGASRFSRCLPLPGFFNPFREEYRQMARDPFAPAFWPVSPSGFEPEMQPSESCVIIRFTMRTEFSFFFVNRSNSMIHYSGLFRRLCNSFLIPTDLASYTT